jgi:Domain of unknown function (DUF1905)/Bacteriocin-protection, YdeI or OmpD-Associated
VIAAARPQMSGLRFRAEIEINNINPYVRVSAEHAARLKPHWRKPLPVCFRVNGTPNTPWRVNLMPVGDGGFYLYLHGEVRKVSGTKVGDTVALEVQFDYEYRAGPAHPMPPWFGAALERNLRAKQAWTALIPSRQKEILRYFSGLKSPRAKARNIQQVVHVLSGGKARFMARSWNEPESGNGN